MQGKYPTACTTVLATESTFYIDLKESEPLLLFTAFFSLRQVPLRTFHFVLYTRACVQSGDHIIIHVFLY